MSFLSDKIWRLLKRGKTTFVYSYATKSGGNDENKKQDDFDIFDFDEHENIIQFYITDEDLAKATIVDKSNYYVQINNKKQYIVLAEDTFTSLEPNADLFKNAVFQEHEIYYDHIDHHVTADYQGHTQGEIWDRRVLISWGE